MPSGKPHSKPASKSMRQFLFSEALQQPRSMTAAQGTPPPDHSSTYSDSVQDSAVELILQGITVEGCRIEGLDSNISALAAETRSIRLGIAGFQNRVRDLEQHVTTVEGHLNAVPNGG
ncbi:hypothetical protein NDU88_000463 [Pleurodeles waltl]|uniref:Uncharacterized protein n=1 Tax=Pleurodeles waltl TaxID=8319 RepID=A0AAV7UU43_PLEWA|nr:hypothetical protein NDU88_000463 [Pleurodeles waltl]